MLENDERRHLQTINQIRLTHISFLGTPSREKVIVNNRDKARRFIMVAPKFSDLFFANPHQRDRWFKYPTGHRKRNTIGEDPVKSC